MPIADSDKPEHQRAFKTGYRYALAGKTLSHMPHDIRGRGDLRTYFAEGWQTAQDQMAEQQTLMAKPNWRYRLVWFSIMVLGGLATAALMSQQIKEEREQQHPPLLQTEIADEQAIALISEQQRADMLYRQQQLAQIEQSRTALSTLIDNPNVRILSAEITAQDQQFPLVSTNTPTQSIEKSPLFLPKYLRKLEFNGQLRLNKPQTIWLYWRYDGLILQKQSFDLTAGDGKLQSAMQMSSARQGKWHLELVDTEQQVFARMAFNYGTVDENH